MGWLCTTFRRGGGFLGIFDLDPLLACNFERERPNALRLVNELVEFRVLEVVCTTFVLPLVHCAIHACLKERSGGFVRAGGSIFVTFIFSAIEIAPNEGGVTV
jgi:hypothetical protein